jgi:hypothetical protein
LIRFSVPKNPFGGIRPPLDQIKKKRIRVARTRGVAL